MFSQEKLSTQINFSHKPANYQAGKFQTAPQVLSPGISPAH